MSACNFAPFPPVQIPPPLPIPKYKPPSFAVTFSIGIEVAPLGLEPPQIPPPLPIPKYKPPSFAVTFSIGIEVAPLGLEPPQIPPPLPIPKIKIPGVPPTVRYCPLDGTITVG